MQLNIEQAAVDSAQADLLATAAIPASARATPAQGRAFNPWLIAMAVVVPTFMEVLDTTIANVALPAFLKGVSRNLKGISLSLILMSIAV